MIRRSPRALAAWCAVGVLALTTARMVGSDLASLHRRATTAGPEIDVVIATRDLPLGATLTDRDVTVRRRFAGRLAPEALRSPRAAVGRVVVVPVLTGNVVSARHLAPRERSGLEGVVPPGMRAVRVVVEDGLQPPPGSVVDVLVSFDPASVDPDTDPTLTVVRGALVLATSPEVDGGGGRGPAVTLLTDVDGAHRLAFAATNGVLTLALAPPEEACCAPSSTTTSMPSR